MVRPQLTFVPAKGSLDGGIQQNELNKRQIPIPITLLFESIEPLRTCEAALFEWFYHGDGDLIMSLKVTSFGSDAVDITITNNLVTTLDPDLDTNTFVWPSVDVPPGTYNVTALIPSADFSRTSPGFQVIPGDDTSCLPPPPASPTDSNPDPDPSTIPALPGKVPEKTRLNTGTIVGIVLGGLALLIACLAAFFFLRRKQRRSVHGKQGGIGVVRGWNGLGSADSRTAYGKKVNPANHGGRSRRLSSARGNHRSNTGSMGPILMTNSDEAIGGNPSEEKLGGRASRKNSLMNSYEDHDSALALAQLPTLHHRNASRDSRNELGMGRNISSSSHAVHEIGGMSSGRRPSYPDSVDLGLIGDRTRHTSTDARARQYPRVQTSDVSVSRNPSLTATSATHDSPTRGDMASPSPATSAEAKKAHRASLGPRPKRKPVPAYDANEVPLPVTSSSAPSSSALAAQPASFSSSPLSHSPLDESVDHHSQSHQSQPSPSPQPHYSTRNVTSSRPGTGDSDSNVNVLQNKSSFGPGGVEGKQLHYLMPDLPPGACRR
ncbi:hypothetical protein FA15DRAFT_700961 [Coprinopsis marcescibilis]|uniref:Uncharacterized protein n=1 Tax=Coprinopsis marcescibilis TaxID=230819 RepID=A0A5C3L655_COPMA|nr:hypothetical protein FA15DRAFT_700961 [Coprinopsis marcescibilis]